MQRLNAAACLLFALLSGAHVCVAGGPLKVEVVQTHTGVKLGSHGLELVSDSDSVWSRCSGTSGSYSKQLGFHCEDSRLTLPGQSQGLRNYAFFYDVRVIMPDEAHLVFHCSTIVDRDCQGFPEYPETTSVECLDFVYSGSAYKDCTAAGHPSERIGIYRASLHGGRMTIFGSNWRRSYMQYGTWQLESSVAQDSKPPQEPQPAADPAATLEPKPSADPATAQDSKSAQDPKPATNSAAAQEPKPSADPATTQDSKPAQEPKPAPDRAADQDPKPSADPATAQDSKPAEDPKPATTSATAQDPKPSTDPATGQDPKPAQTSEVKPASVPDGKSTLPTPPATGPNPAAPILFAGADQAIDPRIIEQAKAGDPVAQYKLGYDYFLGHGEPVDYVQAAIWWRKAADQGYPQAQNNLGVLYNSGKGVPQSFADAYFWQNLAAARTSGPLQAQFAKNRDESASKLWFIARLRVQQRAAKWAADHPVQPRSHEPTDANAASGIKELP